MKRTPTEFWGSIDLSNAKREELEIHPQFIESSKGEMYLASCMNIMRNSYGFVEAVDHGTPIDRDGEPLPLYTYPAIEYLVQFDFGSKRVFEFGSGGSTIFWMKRAREVFAVENNAEWIAKMKPQLAANATILAAEGADFPQAIHQVDGKFDVIVVDSAGFRYDCAVEATKKLADGGLIILDNADWHFNTAAMLKSSGLLQVDMTGFKPCYFHTSTTSIFLHRQFDFPTVMPRQPAYGIGAKKLHSIDWDKPSK